MNLKNLPYRIFRKIQLIRVRLNQDSRPSSYPYISGDTFRSLADHIHDELKTFEPIKVEQSQIVFVKSDLIENFFRDIHPQIPHPYILITHNSDRNITSRDVNLIDEKIIHWFAQNVLVKHPKITPIPIGLENAHYHLHGVTRIFDKLRKEKISKKPRILFGFNIETNPKERKKAQSALENISTADTVPRRMIPKKYLKLLSKYSFVASPPGNGEDCHRTWEALYLKAVPIVRRSVGHEYFQNLGLPMIIINTWDELSRFSSEELAHEYETLMRIGDLEPLYADYWIQKIRKHQ